MNRSESRRKRTERTRSLVYLEFVSDVFKSNFSCDFCNFIHVKIRYVRSSGKKVSLMSRFGHISYPFSSLFLSFCSSFLDGGRTKLEIKLPPQDKKGKESDWPRVTVCRSQGSMPSASLIANKCCRDRRISSIRQN